MACAGGAAIGNDSAAISSRLAVEFELMWAGGADASFVAVASWVTIEGLVNRYCPLSLHSCLPEHR